MEKIIKDIRFIAKENGSHLDVKAEYHMLGCPNIDMYFVMTKEAFEDDDFCVAEVRDAVNYYLKKLDSWIKVQK